MLFEAATWQSDSSVRVILLILSNRIAANHCSLKEA
jgi:hypothetical protein